jgi:hypothetical protein
MTKGHVHGSAGGAGTVLGMEWAGEIAEVGPDARGVKAGDRVMGSGAAAFAEYTLADHGRLFRTPSNMNFEEAATLPVALATMHNAVVTNGALQPGQSVLIQGASSGVGLMAMQIAKLKGAKMVVIGSFLNGTAVTRHLLMSENNILVVCAGWKGKVNLEDTLFAGAIVENLRNHIEPDCDAPLAAQHLYNLARHDMVKFLSNSSHVKRLNRLNIHKDIEFCLTPDQYPVLPVLAGNVLVAR